LLVFKESFWPHQINNADLSADQVTFFKTLANDVVQGDLGPSSVYFCWGEAYDQYWKTQGVGTGLGPYFGFHTTNPSSDPANSARTREPIVQPGSGGLHSLFTSIYPGPPPNFTEPAGLIDSPSFGTLSPVEGLPLGPSGNVTIATFTDNIPGTPAGVFTATITWGDGGTTTVSGAGGGIVALSDSPGQFAVLANHSYTEENSYTVSVQVQDTGGTSISGTATVAVGDAALGSPSINNPGASEGVGLSGFTVATFTDGNAGAPNTDFTAIIQWGDGSTTTLSGTAGSIVALGGGNFALVAGHIFAEDGGYPLSAQVLEVGGASVIGNLTITVADAPLTVTAVNPPVGAVAGRNSGTFTVATFTDAYAGAPITDFTAVIHWGDGTTSTITSPNGFSGSGGSFAVQASHTYTAAIRTTQLAVQILDAGGSSVSGNSTSFNVSSSPVSPPPPAPPLPPPPAPPAPPANSTPSPSSNPARQGRVTLDLLFIVDGLLTGNLDVFLLGLLDYLSLVGG
jgi:hypothetical protein